MFRTPLKLSLSTILLLTCLPVLAGMDEATKAYIRGDYPKARYEALIGATDGDPAAQMLMGQLYFNGEGVDKNLELAMYWYQQAAGSGFTEAQYRLGKLYFEGQTGIQKNYDKAWDWLSKADEAGHDKTEPMLEVLYKQEETGQVVNLNESPDVLKAASDKGVLKAQFLLANRLIKAGGPPNDRTQAVELMTNAAQKGFIKAQKRLGEWYLQGLGVEKNYIEAYGWSMAYAGTKELGGIIREGKQTARTSLRNLPGDQHDAAYLKSKEYFEQFVIPFHKNAREVGPDKYRIVVRSKVDSQDSNVTKQSRKSAEVAKTNEVKASPDSKSAPDKNPAGKSASDPAASDASTDKNSGSIQADMRNQVIKAQSPGSVKPVVPVSTDNTDADKADKAVTTDNLQQQPEQKTVDIKAETPESSQQVNSEPPGQVVINSNTDKVNETRAVPNADNPGVNSALAIKTVPTEKNKPAQPEQIAQRSESQIARTFDTYLTKINELHLRSFQLDKSLQGRMTIMLHIEPNGSVSKVELSSSEIQSTQFEQELSDLLRTLKFGAGNVAPYLFTYQLDLLPQ